jgi:acyl-CoA synthetase (AMP-forming)/AMP-acid ligase II
MNSVAVVDELDRPVPTSLTGEIVVRGPTVFHGYWRRAEDSTLTLRNGWHHTGDLGHLDADGYLWYDRRSETKRLIKSGGENVYPAEVERVILDHPAVAEVAVSGVPDAQWGEAVKATCVMRAGHTLDADALIEFVGQRLARYKRPRHVEFVTELPAAPGPARAR